MFRFTYDLRGGGNVECQSKVNSTKGIWERSCPSKRIVLEGSRRKKRVTEEPGKQLSFGNEKVPERFVKGGTKRVQEAFPAAECGRTGFWGNMKTGKEASASRVAKWKDWLCWRGGKRKASGEGGET